MKVEWYNFSQKKAMLGLVIWGKTASNVRLADKNLFFKFGMIFFSKQSSLKKGKFKSVTVWVKFPTAKDSAIFKIKYYSLSYW
jgi:hypothetical protein